MLPHSKAGVSNDMDNNRDRQSITSQRCDFHPTFSAQIEGYFKFLLSVYHQTSQLRIKITGAE